MSTQNNYSGYSPDPQIYYYTGPPGPPGPSGPPGMPGKLNNTAVSFLYAQLAHVIEQIFEFYPTTTIRVYTPGSKLVATVGLPYEFFSSPDSTYGGLFVVGNEEWCGATPLQSIAAINLGEGIAYNPAINYLSKPTFPQGCDTNIITAVHDFLPISTAVDIYSGCQVDMSGIVYKNEYGMIVITDDTLGNNPTFVPITNIRGIIPDFNNKVTDSTKLLPHAKSKVILTNEEMIE